MSTGSTLNLHNGIMFFFLSIEEFIPLLRERMNVLNPYVRQFLVGWITVLDSVPDIDMLGFLPDFLDGNCSLFES